MAKRNTESPALLPTLGEFLRQIRVLRKESRQTVAERGGVSLATICAVEKGKRGVGRSFIPSLERAYGVEDGALYLIHGNLPPDVHDQITGENVGEMLREIRKAVLCGTKAEE